MFNKLIIKKHFRKLLAQLRGAKKLRDRDDPYFVINTVFDLSKVDLGLKENDFPKILVGSHASKIEILLRQIFLNYYKKICSEIMQSFGSGKLLSIPIPSAWVNHLEIKGVACSPFYCRVYLFFSSMKQTARGFVKFLFLLTQFSNPKHTGHPYVLFLGLQQNNLPSYNTENSWDIISWFKESKIKKQDITKIWVQAKVGKNYVNPDDLVINRYIFPKFSNYVEYFSFLFFGIAALFVSVFGVLRGKWWYGFLFNESIYFHYVSVLKQESIAKDYYFNNTDPFYKPIWAYQVEKMGADVSLYYYSTNIELIHHNNYMFVEDVYHHLMRWNQILVWNQYQGNYLKKFCPDSHFINVGVVDFSGSHFNNFERNDKKILSIFDVTPMRPTAYTGFGYAISPYYTEEVNLKFLDDILNIFNETNWVIYFKQKRPFRNIKISNSFIRKQNDLTNESIKRIDPDIAAKSLIIISDAVISLPFSSPSIIAAENCVPSVFYDPSGDVKYAESHHGIPLLRSKIELKKWCHSLNL